MEGDISWNVTHGLEGCRGVSRKDVEDVARTLYALINANSLPIEKATTIAAIAVVAAEDQGPIPNNCMLASPKFKSNIGMLTR